MKHEIMILLLGITLGILGTMIADFIAGYFRWKRHRAFVEEQMYEVTKGHRYEVNIGEDGKLQIKPINEDEEENEEDE